MLAFYRFFPGSLNGGDQATSGAHWRYKRLCKRHCAYWIEANGRKTLIKLMPFGGWSATIYRIDRLRFARLMARRFQTEAAAKQWAERVLGLYAERTAA